MAAANEAVAALLSKDAKALAAALAKPGKAGQPVGAYAFDLGGRTDKADHLVSGTLLHLAVLSRNPDLVSAALAGGVDPGVAGRVALYHGFEFDDGFCWEEWTPQVLANELGLLHIGELLGGSHVRRKRKKRKKRTASASASASASAAGSAASTKEKERRKSRSSSQVSRAKSSVSPGAQDPDAEHRKSRRRKLRRVKKKTATPPSASSSSAVAATSASATATAGRADSDSSDSDHYITYNPSRRNTIRQLEADGSIRPNSAGGVDDSHLEWTEIAPEDLEIGDRFDSGGYGAIHTGTYAGLPVAVKVMAIPNDAARASFFKELHALSVANSSAHVCKLYGYALVDSALCLVMRLYDGCLHDVIDLCPGHRMTTANIVPAALDIASGLRDLHAMNIVMRDLKPANVLVDVANESLVLADFGLARMVADRSSRELATTMNSACTPSYAPPEAFKDGKLTPAFDIWAFAATVVHMFTGSPPFSGLSMFQIATRVAVNAQSPDIPERAPERLKALLVRCFAHEPRDRPTADVLVEELEALMSEGGF